CTLCPRVARVSLEGPRGGSIRPRSGGDLPWKGGSMTGSSLARGLGRHTNKAAIVGLPLLVASTAGADPIPDLSGTWQFGSCDVGGFDLSCMVLEEDDPLLTRRAKAYRDAIDEAAQ